MTDVDKTRIDLERFLKLIQGAWKRACQESRGTVGEEFRSEVNRQQLLLRAAQVPSVGKHHSSGEGYAILPQYGDPIDDWVVRNRHLPYGTRMVSRAEAEASVRAYLFWDSVNNLVKSTELADVPEPLGTYLRGLAIPIPNPLVRYESDDLTVGARSIVAGPFEAPGGAIIALRKVDGVSVHDQFRHDAVSGLEGRRVLNLRCSVFFALASIVASFHAVMNWLISDDQKPDHNSIRIKYASRLVERLCYLPRFLGIENEVHLPDLARVANLFEEVALTVKVDTDPVLGNTAPYMDAALRNFHYSIPGDSYDVIDALTDPRSGDIMIERIRSLLIRIDFQAPANDTISTLVYEDLAHISENIYANLRGFEKDILAIYHLLVSRGLAMVLRHPRKRSACVKANELLQKAEGLRNGEALRNDTLSFMRLTEWEEWRTKFSETHGVVSAFRNFNTAWHAIRNLGQARQEAESISHRGDKVSDELANDIDRCRIAAGRYLSRFRRAGNDDLWGHGKIGQARIDLLKKILDQFANALPEPHFTKLYPTYLHYPSVYNQLIYGAQYATDHHL